VPTGVIGSDNNWPSNEARFFHHQTDQVRVVQISFLMSVFLCAGTAPRKKLFHRDNRRNFFKFFPGKGVFEEVAVFQFNTRLRERRPRFFTGTSACPLVKAHFHDHRFVLSVA